MGGRETSPSRSPVVLGRAVNGSRASTLEPLAPRRDTRDAMDASTTALVERLYTTKMWVEGRPDLGALLAPITVLEAPQRRASPSSCQAAAAAGPHHGVTGSTSRTASACTALARRCGSMLPSVCVFYPGAAPQISVFHAQPHHALCAQGGARD